MNANNNRIIIKVKKSPCWKNCEEDDIKVGDTIRWVGQYKVMKVEEECVSRCFSVVEEMQVDKITAKYKKVAKGKVFQKRNDKEYNKAGRTDEQRFKSGIKNLTTKPTIHTCMAEADDAWSWWRVVSFSEYTHDELNK